MNDTFIFLSTLAIFFNYQRANNKYNVHEVSKLLY